MRSYACLWFSRAKDRDVGSILISEGLGAPVCLRRDQLPSASSVVLIAGYRLESCIAGFGPQVAICMTRTC